MTVSTRTSAPTYKIFEPDALDQIYAKGNLDPIMGGISYAFGSAHKQEGAANQQQYLASQERFNKMAANLDAMEIEQKRKEAVLKIAGGLIQHGEDPTKVSGGNEIYLDPSQALLPGLLRGKIQSEIDRNGAAAGASGKEGYDTIQTVTTPPGSNAVVTHTTKRKPGQLDMSMPGPTSPKSSTAVPQQENSNIGQIVATRAKAALGPDAVLIKEVDGRSAWGSPTTKKTVTFDSTGKQLR